MRFACVDATGFFLVDVLDQLATHGRDRACDVGAGDQDRKVTHVRGVFLLQVDVQPVFLHEPLREGRPSPVRLPLHDPEQRFLEVVSIHAGRTLAPHPLLGPKAWPPRARDSLVRRSGTHIQAEVLGSKAGKAAAIAPLSRTTRERRLDLRAKSAHERYAWLPRTARSSQLYGDSHGTHVR